MADAKIVVSAQDNASRVLTQVRGSLDQVQSVATRVGSALGLVGVAGVGGLALLVKGSIDGVDALNDLADATGASVENISALEDMAARTGSSMDTVSTAMVKFNSVLKDATPGSGADAVLKSIGLSADELRKMDPAEALLKTAQALSGFADDGNKARITQELFGKSLKEVAPLLKDLADQGGLVAKVTKEQTAEAERFNKELFNLQKNVTDASRSLVGPMVSSINKTIDLFRLGAIEGKSFYKTLRDEQLRLLGLNDGPQEYAARIAEITEKLKGNNLHASQRAQLLREQASLEKKLANGPSFAPDNQSAAELNRLSRRPSAPNVAGPTKSASNGKSQAQKDQEEFERERMKMQRQVAIEAGDAVIAGNQAYQKSLIEQTASTEKFIESLMKEELAQDEANARMREGIEEIGLTTEQVNALRLARLDSNIALEEQNQLTRFELGASAEVLNFYQRKLEMMKEQRDLTARGQIATAAVETKKEQAQASKDYAKGVHDDLKGALSAAFRDTKDPLGAFGDALANVIYTRAATALAESMATSALGGSAGGGGGLLSALFSFDGGGYTGGGSRSGGLDGKGGFMAIMHPQESVLDHTKGQGVGGNMVVNIVEAPGKGGQTASSNDGGVNVLTVFVEQVKSAIASDISRGSGAIPAALAQTYAMNRVAGAY